MNHAETYGDRVGHRCGTRSAHRQRRQQRSGHGSSTVAALLAVVVMCSWPTVAKSDAGAAAVPAVVSDLRPLHTSAGRIVDDMGRDTLLRGANLNSLGEYWQGTTVPPTFPTTDADWESMAAQGFSAVRLLVTWSRIEPSPGVYDDVYLAQVDAQVQAAAAHGIYSVIDMHQDAYSAFISWNGEACPEGTTPAKGWDGAPAWAVIIDSASTCTPGERNATPAVRTAWQHFYDNSEGISDRFVAMWGHVAQYFGGRPDVAGYDLLNEPEVPGPASEIGPKYNQLLADVIAEIRAAEADDPFEHLLFVEPALPAGNFSDGLVIPDPALTGTDTRNLVSAPHNYSESISNGLNLTVEAMNDLIGNISAGIGVPVWIGEYGYWSTSADDLDAAQRQATDDDARRWGGAWWQWAQSCGDPHSIFWDAGTGEFRPSGQTQIHLNQVTCPGNERIGPTAEFMSIVGRGYGRSMPGTYDLLRNDMAARTTIAAGTLSTLPANIAARQVEVWTPTGSDIPVYLENVSNLEEIAVGAGRLLIGYVIDAGCYAVKVGDATTVCVPDETPTSAPSTTTTAPNTTAQAIPTTGATPKSARPHGTTVVRATTASAKGAVPRYTG